MTSTRTPQRGKSVRGLARLATWVGVALVAALLIGCEGQQAETPLQAVNSPPSANAGPDIETYSGTPVTLDGSNSNDIDGDPLSYQWEQTKGTPVELSLASTATPSFIAPMEPGELEFSLVVSDGRRNSEADKITVTVVRPTPPTADAGKFITTPRKGQVTLHGSASSEMEEATLQYNWMQTHGEPVTLEQADTLEPEFTAPDKSGFLLFSLKVTDNFDNSAEDSVAVQVLNEPPVAHARVSQTVVGFGDEVTLDGSASTDPDGDELSYSWSQVLGSPVELSDPNAPKTRFTAPDAIDHLAFALTVSDGEFTSHKAIVYVETSDDPAAIAEAAAAAKAAPGGGHHQPMMEKHHDGPKHAKKAAHHKAHWSYEGDTGPEHWGSLSPDYALCGTGKAQSPIDIRAVDIIDTNPIEFHYQPSKLHVVNNGHTIQANYDPGSYMVKDGVRYDLLQFHFHSPSEHAIEGKQTDMVAHLVHKSAEGKLAVVGVLLDQGDENPVLKPIWDIMPSEKGKADADVEINAADLLPEDRTYFHYMGSLTTPPCSEGVNWNVMAKPVSVSAGQVEAFTAIFPLSVRPLQPVNGRTIGRYQ